MPTSTRTRAYLICGTPRTGSTLLCGLLRSTGVAGRPESYFRLPDVQMWADRWQLARDSGAFDYRDYVRAAVVAGSSGNGIFGARVMWGTIDEMVAELGAVHPELAGADLDLLTTAFGPTRFVHLRRDDTVAQAVSWLRAEQTNFWQYGDTLVSGKVPVFDAERIRHTVRTIDEHNAAWQNWFAAIDVQPYLVSYEELTADMAGVTSRILDFLGLELPAGRTLVPRHHRQADEVNAEWIARYGAIYGDAGTAPESS